MYIDELTIYHTIPALTTLREMPFESSVGKGEIAGTSIFSFYQNVFYSFQNKL